MEEKSKLILVWNVDMGTVMRFTYTETFRRYGYGELFFKSGLYKKKHSGQY